jgi:NitT/TauT family transport system ATP-binding protein
MREWLLDIWEADRKTVVIVTHDVEEALFLADRVVVLSARPARVLEVVDVGLPRPRTLAMTGTPAFGALREALLEPLREEARAGLGVV